MLAFAEGGKPEYSENPRSMDENQQQTQPTYDAETGNRTRATLVGGECSHHCVIPAPLLKFTQIYSNLLKFNFTQFTHSIYSIQFYGVNMVT